LKIVVDCANGAGYKVAPRVLDELGAQVITIGDQPDGLNINAGCGATDLAALQARVLAEKADLGIALDGDGDRLMMVDAQGQALDGDSVTWILAKAGVASGRIAKAVVGTLMTNLGLEVALKSLGLSLRRTDVGDKYVMQALKDEDLILGAEPSGHIICMDRIQTGDGLVAALQVLEILVKSGAKLADLCAGFVPFPQVNKKFPTQNKLIAKSSHVLAKKALLENELGDEGRIILRPSGTEPIVRVTVEGRDFQRIEQVAQSLVQTLQQADA
jgi:phosphoglucosamine mutase